MNNSGEFEFINSFSGKFNEMLPENIVGIGDDCAVVPFNDTESLLMTTDALVDSVHFIKEKITPFTLAYKSLVVNLSDIAAMGGKPLYVLLSISVPPEIDVSWLDSFFQGLYESCRKYHVNLIGGDT